MTEHPDFPIESWQAEVANLYTLLGYHDWLDCKLAIQDDPDFRLSQVLERQGVETL